MDAVTLTANQQAALDAFNALPTWDAPRMVSLDCLEFTSWNVNEMGQTEFNELVSEVEEGSYETPDGIVAGFDEPVGLMPIPGEPGRYLVPSGEHRVRAAHALKLTHVPAVLKIHLTEMDEHDVKIWTVKRNHIRGRINADKYASLEKSLNRRHAMRVEVARERMLVKGDRLKRLRKNQAVLDNEEGGGPPSRGGKGKAPAAPAAPSEPISVDIDETPAGGDASERPESSGQPAQPSGGQRPDTDGEKDRREELKDRRSLLAALKTAERDVLLVSADSVPFGYLFFAQGAEDQTHLVVDESPKLHMLVKRMVAAAKKDSAKVDEFLVSAITKELREWEDQ